MRKPVTAPDANARFPRSLRLRKPAEYKDVFARGRRLRDPLLSMVCQANALSYPRLGLAIAKKAAPDASQRNLIKRQIREHFRTHRHELGGYDLVFAAQPAAARATREQLRRSIAGLWKQLIARCAS